MTGIAESGTSADPGTIVPFTKVTSTQPTNSEGECPGGSIQRLARRLSTSQSCVLGVYEAEPSDFGSSRLASSGMSPTQSNAHGRSRLSKAWEILLELASHSTSIQIQERLSVLLGCLEVTDRFGKEPRVAVREYLVRMQLYALLPLYLRVDECSLDTALDESISFASQAVSLIDLDRGLESELFELLSEPRFSSQPPSVALEQALKVDLGRLTNALAMEASKSSKNLPIENDYRIQTDRCTGYWSIAQQWLDGSAHLRIPPQLSIGKVLWPKVREHWTRFSQALLEVAPNAIGSAEQKDVTTDDDFIEIRNSNDPQLARTLDIQLHRCRDTHRSMSLVVVKELDPTDPCSKQASGNRLPYWQEMVIKNLQAATDGQTTRGFLCEAGELTLVIDGLDRNEVSTIMREVIEVASQPLDAESSMVEVLRVPIVCGIACVASPSKRFQIEQLIQSAWRCLDAAKLHGPGTVKSIEVF